MKMKKVLTLALTFVMIFAFSSIASAAELSADEKAFLNKVKAGYSVGTETLKVSDAYTNALETYLLNNDVTAANIASIEKNIDAAVAIVKNAGVSSIDKLTGAQKNEVMSYVSKAAAVENLKVNLSTDGTLKVTDSANKEVFSAKATANIAGDSATTSDTVVKKTGLGLEATAAVVALLAVALVSCAVVSKKRTVEA